MEKMLKRVIRVVLGAALIVAPMSAQADAAPVVHMTQIHMTKGALAAISQVHMT
jgi:hypothetical protein